MNNFRCYGKAPYKVVTVHGGPGALGDMGYVSEKLSKEIGVVEALQTKKAVTELIDELLNVIKSNCEAPVILIGHSWGAWLAYLAAAESPGLVAKLVLVGSGPFLPEYAREIESTRMGRLTPKDRNELESLFRDFHSGASAEKGRLMGKIGAMIERADAYSLQPIDDSDYQIEVDGDMFSPIWSEAAELRTSGKLLGFASKVKSDVIVIHGDYDPHPLSGVIEPLSGKIEKIRKVVLAKCGHYPWKEKYVHDEFFRILSDIIGEFSRDGRGENTL